MEKKFKNIRQIPVNLLCGDLLDLRYKLIAHIRDYSGIEQETKDAISGLIGSQFDSKIFEAIENNLAITNEIRNNMSQEYSKLMQEHLDKITTYTKDWYPSPDIPAIKHDTNQFGHAPKPKTAPKKYKHILFNKPAKDIKTMKNLSRKFGEWVKYKAGNRRGGACNITFYEGDATMELSFNCDSNRIYISFYGINEKQCYDWIPCRKADKEYYATQDFWRMYKRRITKTIARMIREIENNSNNWEYIEDEHE